ncbi:MAG: glycosyltransferase family 4 protein [Candidatus Zixiibacteriota bacterium]
MRILWLRADYLFPLTTGSRIRSYSLLSRICGENELAYFGFHSPSTTGLGDEITHCVGKVQTLPKEVEKTTGGDVYFRVAANLLTAHPYFTRRNRSSELTARVSAYVKEHRPDVIVCDGLDSSLNIDFGMNIPTALYHHSIETHLWHQRYETATGSLQRSYFNYETKRMAAFESDMCNRFDLIITSSARDTEALKREFNVRKPISVVPIGVDCTYFRPDPLYQVVPRRLVFSGRMDLLSNIDQLLWFVSEIYPLVKRQYPDISFVIAGRDPASEIVTLGQSDPSITVTGSIDDIRPFVASADIYVVPLRVPGGTRVKLYEAMALKRPIVSTSHGCDGLEVVPNRDLLVADTPRDFAQAIISLLSDQHRKEALAEQGWRLVNRQCDWSIRAAQFLERLQSLADSAKRSL